MPTAGEDQEKRVTSSRGASAPGPRAAPHEQDRRRRGADDRRARLAEPLLAPVSESPTTSSAASLAASITPSRPGGAICGSAGMPANCCTAARRWRAGGSRRGPSPRCRRGRAVQVGAVGAGDPGGQLERGPVVLGAAEGDEHGAIVRGQDSLLSRATSTHVAGRVAQDGADVAARDTRAEQRAAAVEHQQVDRLLFGEADQVAARFGRGEDGGARVDVVGDQLGADLAEVARGGSRGLRLSVWSPPRTLAPRGGGDQPGEDQLARAVRSRRAARPGCAAGRARVRLRRDAGSSAPAGAAASRASAAPRAPVRAPRRAAPRTCSPGRAGAGSARP